MTANKKQTEAHWFPCMESESPLHQSLCKIKTTEKPTIAWLYSPPYQQIRKLKGYVKSTSLIIFTTIPANMKTERIHKIHLLLQMLLFLYFFFWFLSFSILAQKSSQPPLACNSFALLFCAAALWLVDTGRYLHLLKNNLNLRKSGRAISSCFNFSAVSCQNPHSQLHPSWQCPFFRKNLLAAMLISFHMPL